MAYDPVKRLDELTLRCRGIVIVGAGKPIVLCAVDWIGIANEGHDQFREMLADAAGTTRRSRRRPHPAPARRARLRLHGRAADPRARAEGLRPVRGRLPPGGDAAGRQGDQGGGRVRAAGHALRLGRRPGEGGRLQPPHPRAGRQGSRRPLHRDQRPRPARRAGGGDRPGGVGAHVLERGPADRGAQLLRLSSAELLPHRHSQPRFPRHRPLHPRPGGSRGPARPLQRRRRKHRRGQVQRRRQGEPHGARPAPGRRHEASLGGDEETAAGRARTSAGRRSRSSSPWPRI